MTDVFVQSDRAERVSVHQLSSAIAVELRKAARKARVPRPVSSGGGGFRARRSDKLFKRFLIISFFVTFVVPTLLSSAYFGLIAADQFTSEARFAVKSSDGALPAVSGLSSLLGGGNTDAAIVTEYVESMTIVEELRKSFDLGKIFGIRGYDVFAALAAGAPAEDLLLHWKKQISVTLDRSSGLITLKVRTFDARDSENLTRAVVFLAERTVNELTHRNEGNALLESRKELDKSKIQLEKAVSTVRDARRELGILDSEISAKAISQILTALNLEASKVSVQIDTLRKSAATNGPQLKSLSARLEALREQILGYQNQLTGEGSDRAGSAASLADRTAVLSQALLDLKIAQSEYAKAFSGFELARMTSERQRSYLLTYVQPRAAEDASYPKRILMSLALAIGSFLLWAAIMGAAVLVRDHTAS